MASLDRFTTAGAPAEYLDRIRDLFFSAFDERFTEDDWQHCLGGWHVVAQDRGMVIAHAAVVSRVLEVGHRTFRTGYVEGVATRPDRQGRGWGALVMGEVAKLIRSKYQMGALATNVQAFYERLGWQRWDGPTFVRDGSELIRTEDEDGGIMVLLFGPSAGAVSTDPIACERRSGDDW